MYRKQSKIIDAIKISDGISYSIEVTQNIREDLLTNYIEVEPLFYSITWHAAQHECRNLDIAPIKLARLLKKYNKNILLHVSCHLLRKSFLNELTLMLKKEGICNLFVILGENYNSDASDFKSTQELIRYIREETADYFCIGVAAYPDREDKIKHLKEKIESGADFAITQACFDVEIYSDFLNNCKASGITVPILPGIFPFETEKELTGFANLCKVHVTNKNKDELKITSAKEIVKKLVTTLSVVLNLKHFHFFTLDKIDRALDLIKNVRNT